MSVSAWASMENMSSSGPVQGFESRAPTSLVFQQDGKFSSHCAALSPQSLPGLLGPRRPATTRASLLPAAEFSIESAQEADFGVPLMKNGILHLADFLQRHGTLPSTFTTERKHKTIGKYATNLQKTTAFESHLMQQVVAMEITTLKEPGLFPDSCQLVKPKKATKQQFQVLRHFVDGPANEAMVASSAKLARGGTTHDVVVFHQQDGRPFGIGCTEEH